MMFRGAVLLEELDDRVIGIHEIGFLCVLSVHLSQYLAQKTGLVGEVATQIAPEADLLETCRHRAFSENRASRRAVCA